MARTARVSINSTRVTGAGYEGVYVRRRALKDNCRADRVAYDVSVGQNLYRVGFATEEIPRYRGQCRRVDVRKTGYIRRLR